MSNTNLTAQKNKSLSGFALKFSCKKVFLLKAIKFKVKKNVASKIKTSI